MMRQHVRLVEGPVILSQALTGIREEGYRTSDPVPP